MESVCGIRAQRQPVRRGGAEMSDVPHAGADWRKTRPANTGHRQFPGCDAGNSV